MNKSFAASLFLSLLFFACAEKEPKVTSISMGNDQLTDLNLKLSNIENEISLQLNKENDSVAFVHNEPILLELRSGNISKYAFVKPGEHLILKSFTKDPGLATKTEISKENQYLNQLAKARGEANKQYPVMDLCGKNPDSFRLLMKKRYAPQQQLLAKVGEDSEIATMFPKILAKSIIAERAGLEQAYPTYHRYVTGERPELGEDYFEAIDSINLLDSTLINLAEVRSLGISRYNRHIDFQDYETSADFYRAQYDTLEHFYPPSLLRDYCRLTNVQEQIDFGSGIDGAQSYIDDFRGKVSNTVFNQELNETIEPWEKLKSGMPAPNFVGKDIDDHETALTQLQGKKVYIDVWATWCKPCIAEIPALKELEEELHDENVAFLSISIDELRDKEKWKQFVADEDLQGLQWMADNGWKSVVAQNYNVQGIPRFIVIDEDGTIETAQAPRPSDPKIKEVLLN